jgi:epoxyqueuosine reductase
VKSGEYPLFRDIQFGVADANDPIFQKYKDWVHLEHWTPIEAAKRKADELGWKPKISIASVFVYILFISKEVIQSNLKADRNITSDSWIGAKYNIDQNTKLLGEELGQKLRNRGYFTFDPIEVEGYARKQFKQTWNKRENRTWGAHFSVRHAAFAAGLGTFSLNDGFITDVGGITLRIGTIITEIKLPVSKRTHDESNFRENCLWYRTGGKKCGKCIEKCPVDAIKAEVNGHYKNVCAGFVFGKMAPYSLEHYGIPEYGCGKCQIGLPCTYKRPTEGDA